jgi:hypothetical protein
MCQMCEEYEAELRRMGIAMDEKVTVEFDHDAMDALGHRAEVHGHDVASEVRSIVLEKIAQPPKEIDWIARSRQIRAMTPPGSLRVDSWKLIRASRDWDH